MILKGNLITKLENPYFMDSLYRPINKIMFSTSSLNLTDNLDNAAIIRNLKSNRNYLEYKVEEIDKKLDQSRNRIEQAETNALNGINNVRNAQENFLERAPDHVKQALEFAEYEMIESLEQIDVDKQNIDKETRERDPSAENLYNEKINESVKCQNKFAVYGDARITRYIPATEEYKQAKRDKTSVLSALNKTIRDHRKYLTEKDQIKNELSDTRSTILEMESNYDNPASIAGINNQLVEKDHSDLKNKPEDSGASAPSTGDSGPPAPSTGGSLIDDYADVSTEPMDYTPGDD